MDTVIDMSPAGTNTSNLPSTVTPTPAAVVTQPTAASMGSQQYMAAQMNNDLSAYQALKLNCQYNNGAWTNLSIVAGLAGHNCTPMFTARTTYCKAKCSYENQVSASSGNAAVAQACASTKQQYCNMECNGVITPLYTPSYTATSKEEAIAAACNSNAATSPITMILLV